MAGQGEDGERDEGRRGPISFGQPQLQEQLEAALRLHRAGSLAEAALAYREILQVDPDHADALHLLGVAAYQTGRHADAAQWIGRAVEINPHSAFYYANLGNALTELGRFGEAIGVFQTAIRLAPEDVAAQTNLAHAFNRLGWFDKALTAADAAVALAPNRPEAHYNRGIALTGLGEPQAAVQAYETALGLRPDFAEARSNLGVALFDLGRIDEAIAAYDAALSLNPDLADTHRNKAYALLSRGDWTAGWVEYEWRWRAVAEADKPGAFSRPQWRGEDIAGRTILLHAEQGLGDTIQFCRYASLVSDRGARVVLQVPRPLLRPLGALRGVDAVIGEEEVLPQFDLHCPLMSLPGVFRTAPDTIPATGAYIAAEPVLAQAWAERLGPRRAPRIGLAWSGRAAHRYDRHRSLPLARLLAALPAGLDYVSLQPEVRPADQPALADRPDMRHFGAELTDFADTAGLVSQMDVVVAVDTSVAHLAGAMGKDVRLLLPGAGLDWRWLTGREDTPWYPTMRLYRQGPGQDWTGPLDSVAGHLARLAGRTTA